MHYFFIFENNWFGPVTFKKKTIYFLQIKNSFFKVLIGGVGGGENIFNNAIKTDI